MKVLIVILLLFAAAANAELINSKSVDSVDVSITHSGSLNVGGNVQKANITYYIPQEGLVALNASSSAEMSWSYIYDQYGNRILLLEWTRPSGFITYKIEMSVSNKAKHSYEDKAIGSNTYYLQQTPFVKINDEIREAAFPYEKSLRRAAELTKYVYDFVEYDLSYVGKNVPSDQVIKNGRGVCVEHANLLAAMLRANGIPTRYIVGYAYSPAQDKFIGHTWLEVLLVDGTWVPLDPTWMQAGYLDATHIKSASLLDNSQIDTLTYVGGDIEWKRNEEVFRLIDYREKNITSISVSGVGSTTSSGYGYIKATLGVNECTIVSMNALSCVDYAKRRQLNIFEPNRTIWVCAPTDIYWFYQAQGNNYICPTVIYDQTGSRSQMEVTVSGTATPSSVRITGPNGVVVGENYTLTASTEGIFYSKDFGLNDKLVWNLQAKKSGSYHFYLYNDGLYIKDVDVYDRKEFEVASSAPQDAALGSSFNISLYVKNLLDAKSVKIKLQYADQTIDREELFATNEEKTFVFGIRTDKEGLNDLIITVSGDTLYSETIPIMTPFGEKNVLDSIGQLLSDFFAWLGGLL